MRKSFRLSFDSPHLWVCHCRIAEASFVGVKILSCVAGKFHQHLLTIVVTVLMTMGQQLEYAFLLLQANSRQMRYVLDGAARHTHVLASP
ncbi:hypothetical protein COCSADRAFT_222233 [Bipolaris sorokiniana ND90Pr]|uniref:Uncharacterized protein n=1 Tax=Cochliobolus sativus (strain ND90Pr / ATCC 201652) TaxID=665912 RepID=M2T0N0_COCSN|nr:uncharacterized protein COCSADRAFT_222233 [Bipolaris sorokiniana ND90Pr]EMD62572.1 hypothetical protein COCSADRAFT_222233 [Bipolaris sorokiniana ND90Pr]